jgi:hypothetical protein
MVPWCPSQAQRCEQADGTTKGATRAKISVTSSFNRAAKNHGTEVAIEEMKMEANMS